MGVGRLSLASVAKNKKGLIELRLLDLSQTNAHANGTQLRQNPIYSAWLPTSLARPHTSNYTSSQECLAGWVHSCMCQNNARVRIPYRPLHRPASPTTYRHRGNQSRATGSLLQPLPP